MSRLCMSVVEQALPSHLQLLLCQGSMTWHGSHAGCSLGAEPSIYLIDILERPAAARSQLPLHPYAGYLPVQACCMRRRACCCPAKRAEECFGTTHAVCLGHALPQQGDKQPKLGCCQ